MGFVACIEGDGREMGDFVLWGQRWNWGFWMELMDRERTRVRAMATRVVVFSCWGAQRNWCKNGILFYYKKDKV